MPRYTETTWGTADQVEGAIVQSPEAQTLASTTQRLQLSERTLPEHMVGQMLDMAHLTANDRLVHLGSGDGRLVIAAAERGAHARGIDAAMQRVLNARESAQAAEVSALTEFEQADVLRAKFDDATVVMLQLLPSDYEQLEPLLLDLAPGTRIVSYQYPIGQWTPDYSIEVEEDCPPPSCMAHLWTVPAHIAGVWMIDGGGQLEIQQEYQQFAGFLRAENNNAPQAIYRGRMEGNHIRFESGKEFYRLELQGSSLVGTLKGKPWRATRL